MCVCVRPSWRMSPALTGRGGAASLFSCARARRVKSCRGSLTHTLRPWALSHIRTMRLRRLGLGLGPRARRFSHSRPVLHPRLGRRLRACHGAQSGWPLHCSVRKEEVVSFLKHEDPWRYRNPGTPLVFRFPTELVCDGSELPITGANFSELVHCKNYSPSGYHCKVSYATLTEKDFLLLPPLSSICDVSRAPFQKKKKFPNFLFSSFLHFAHAVAHPVTKSCFLSSSHIFLSATTAFCLSCKSYIFLSLSFQSSC